VKLGVIDEETLTEDSRKSSRNKGRRGSSSSGSLKQQTTDFMDSSMGQSGTTDMTEEVDNSSSRRRQRHVDEAARTLSFVQESNEDRHRTSRSRKSSHDKIREYDSKGSAAAAAAARSRDKEDHDDLLAEKRRAVNRPGAYTASQNDDGYSREKARLFGDTVEEPEPEPVEITGMEHGDLLQKRAPTAVEKKKRKSSSVAPAPSSVSKKESFEEEYQEKTSRSKSSNNSSGDYSSINKSDDAMQNDQQLQVVASHGRAATPGYEYATTSGGYAGPGFETFDDEGLAIAIAVDDDYYDGENMDYYHHAVEYNPDAKPPLHRNRRFRFYSIIVTLLVIVASVGGAVAIVMLRKNSADDGLSPTLAPSEPPTTHAEGVYRVQFASIVGDDANVPETPEDRAAIWIMYEDQSRLAPTEDRLIQRYILALFYFFTTNNEERTWKSCNRPLFNEEDTCDFMRFNRNPYTDEIFFEPEEATRWLSKTHECDWVGVQCDENDVVVAIELCKCNSCMDLWPALVLV